MQLVFPMAAAGAQAAPAAPAAPVPWNEALAAHLELDNETVDHVIKPFPGGRLVLTSLEDFVNTFASQEEARDLAQSHFTKVSSCRLPS